MATKARQASASSQWADGPTGFLEICKLADGQGISGQYSFEVAGRTVSVPVGACSAAMELPAGAVTVVEQMAVGTAVSSVTVEPVQRLLSTDLPNRRATVTIAAGDVSQQTMVTFTNRIDNGRLKICKVAGSGIEEGRNFTFTVAGRSVSVPAGPAPGGYCVVDALYPAGVEVTIVESVPTGVEVAGIAVAPADRAVSTQPGSATAIVRIGSGVTEATFTNRQIQSSTTTVPPTTVPSNTTTVPPTTVPQATTTLPPVTTTSPPTTRPPVTTTVPPTTAPPTTSPTTRPTVPPTLPPVTTTLPPVTTTTVPGVTTTLPPTTAPPTPPQASPTTTVPPSSTTVPPPTATVPPSVTPPVGSPPTTGPPSTVLPPSPTSTVPPTSPPQVTTTTAPPPPPIPPPSLPPVPDQPPPGAPPGVSPPSVPDRLPATGGQSTGLALVAAGLALAGALLLMAGAQGTAPLPYTQRGPGTTLPVHGRGWPHEDPEHSRATRSARSRFRTDG